MYISLKLKMVTMPNFNILDDGRMVKRQDGLGPLPKIPVAELTPKQAQQCADEMLAAFMSHLQKRKGSLND